MSHEMCPTQRSPRRQPSITRRRPRPVAWLALALLAALPGCGTTAGDTLFNAASAAGTTAFDLFLTAAVNSLLDIVNAPPPSSTTQPSGGSGGGGGGNFGGLTGDSANGQSLFMANNCAACHCADASGGCALSAPALVGVSAAQLDDRLRGTISHPGGKFTLTDQEIVDLEAYLAAP